METFAAPRHLQGGEYECSLFLARKPSFESQQLSGDVLPREINALPLQFVRVNNGGQGNNDIAINLSANVSFYQRWSINAQHDCTDRLHYFSFYLFFFNLKCGTAYPKTLQKNIIQERDRA